MILYLSFREMRSGNCPEIWSQQKEFAVSPGGFVGAVIDSPYNRYPAVNSLSDTVSIHGEDYSANNTWGESQ